jgi:SprT-like family.
MKSLVYVRAEYDRLDKLCRVNTKNIRLSTYSKQHKTVAACWFHTNNFIPYSITFNNRYLCVMPEVDYVDIIRHEYAHAVSLIRTHQDCGHNSIWKDICLEVGCRPSPYSYNLNKLEQLVGTNRPDEQDCAVECLKCGNITYHRDDSRIVSVLRLGRSSWNYRCDQCGGFFFRFPKEEVLLSHEHLSQSR